MKKGYQTWLQDDEYTSIANSLIKLSLLFLKCLSLIQDITLFLLFSSCSMYYSRSTEPRLAEGKDWKMVVGEFGLPWILWLDMLVWGETINTHHVGFV